MRTIKISGGDFSINLNGGLDTVTGVEKTSQTIARLILSYLKDKKFYSQIEVSSAITSAVNDIKTLQANDTTLSDKERIKDIKNFFIIADEDDPSINYWVLDLVTESNDTLTRLFDEKTLTDLSHLIG